MTEEYVWLMVECEVCWNNISQPIINSVTDYIISTIITLYNTEVSFNKNIILKATFAKLCRQDWVMTRQEWSVDNNIGDLSIMLECVGYNNSWSLSDIVSLYVTTQYVRSNKILTVLNCCGAADIVNLI